MTTQTLIWTACPAGVDSSGNYRLSIHVAPRLVPNTSPSTLSEFPDFLAWPSVNLGTIRVVFGNNFMTNGIVATNPAPDMNRWQDLFSSTTPVRGRAFEDYTQRRIRSYPTANILQHLHDSYALFAATSGDTYPTVQQLQPFIQPLAPEIIEGKRALIEQDIAPPGYVIPNKAPGVDIGYDFAELQRFHTPPAVIQPQTGPAIPQVDFHDMLSYAQDHPALQRILGIVIDLRLLEPPPAGFTTVRLRIGWNAQVSGTINVFPRTECEVGAGVFRAVPIGGELQNGYYRLDDANQFGVAPVDQDGGGLKAINFAAEIDRAYNQVGPYGGHKTVDTPTSYALPAMRATGLAVFHKDRATKLRSTKFVRGLSNLDANLLTGLSPGDNVLLFADDLTQGGRFDVMDTAVGVWRSISARAGNLLFKTSNTNLAVAYDEAPTNTAASGAHDGSTDDLHLGEIVATWDGWSLGARRPGKQVDPATETVQPHDSSADPNGMQLEISHTVLPGSLPRLRFGHRYQFRARAVDLAGNSLPLADPVGVHATPPVLFGRMDPVQSPELLLRSALAPSDAVNRLVLRSNYNAPPSPQSAERHVVAPKIAQRTAEWHGRFDTPPSPSVVDGSANAYALIANRESKLVTDLPSAQPDPSGLPDVFFFDVDALTVPYLPDPVAIGLLFRGIGIAPAPDLSVPFSGTWPTIDGVRVVARERQNGDPDFAYDAPTNRIDVFLDKAERRLVRLSCIPDPAVLAQFLLWQWLIDVNAVTPALQQAVLRGAHWMFTPYRDLTFVHAVQQPLAPPDFVQISAPRNPGDTFATLTSTPPGTFSRASTARVDIEAAWPEYVDGGPGAPDPPTQPDPNVPAGWLNRPARTAIAVSIPIAEIPQFGQLDQLFLNEAPAPGARHEFGDTKHRDVTYSPRAYSRFDEFFRVDGNADFTNGDTVTLDNRGIVTGSLKLTSVVNGSTVSYADGRDFTVDGTGGRVTRRRDPNTNSPLVADLVRAAWVPRPNDRLTSAPVVTNVFASARPDPPVLVYAIPTFGWQGSGSGANQSRTRQGRSVRVYLERPWWSSGGGEQLGVVLAATGNGQQPLDDATALVATQWGIDPIHVGAATVAVPDPTMFPRRVATDTNLTVAEVPSASLQVAGHAVGFDAARDLWYCDVDLAPGAAWNPFVRLALARYQPNAAPNLRLSPVVLADFVQLAADRTAVVMPGLKPRQYTVQLSGPGYSPGFANDTLGPRATVRIQKRRPGFAADDPLAWIDVATKQLARTLLAGPNVVYSATITVAITTIAAGARLLFEEFEQVRTDGLASGTPTYGDRPVYADVLVLS